MPYPIAHVDQDRYWRRVDQSAGPDACWPWQGRLDRYGYGEYRRRFGHRGEGGGSYWRAHRVAYELLVGPIPNDLVIDHLCRNRSCCNPAHMEPVTNAENLHRGAGHARLIPLPLCCPNGHEYTVENTLMRYYPRDGRSYRTCRACAKERRRRHRA